MRRIVIACALLMTICALRADQALSSAQPRVNDGFPYIEPTDQTVAVLSHASKSLPQTASYKPGVVHSLGMARGCADYCDTHCYARDYNSVCRSGSVNYCGSRDLYCTSTSYNESCGHFNVVYYDSDHNYLGECNYCQTCVDGGGGGGGSPPLDGTPENRTDCTPFAGVCPAECSSC